MVNDLDAVGLPRSDLRGHRPAADTLAMTGYNYWSAERRNPCSVLGMLYALEVIASVYGGPFATAMRESLLLEDSRGISFIDHHPEWVSEFRLLRLSTKVTPISQGDTLGGGLESVMPFHKVIFERSAQAGFPEVVFNLFPGMGAWNFTIRKAGFDVANEMILSGRLYTAEELHRRRLVDMVVDDGYGEDALINVITSVHPRLRGTLSALRARNRAYPITLEGLLDMDRPPRRTAPHRTRAQAAGFLPAVGGRSSRAWAPTGACSRTNSKSAPRSASSTFVACATISGPTPSPASTAILCLAITMPHGTHSAVAPDCLTSTACFSSSDLKKGTACSGVLLMTAMPWASNASCTSFCESTVFMSV